MYRRNISTSFQHDFSFLYLHCNDNSLSRLKQTRQHFEKSSPFPVFLFQSFVAMTTNLMRGGHLAWGFPHQGMPLRNTKNEQTSFRKFIGSAEGSWWRWRWREAHTKTFKALSLKSRPSNVGELLHLRELFSLPSNQFSSQWMRSTN